MRCSNRLNAVGILAGLCLLSTGLWADAVLLNASYDATRELYEAYNPAFAAHWLKTTGQTLDLAQSHGGSGGQALAVINGLDADVVTLGVSSDVDAIADQARLLPHAWRERLPDNSSPYTSTIVFLVRRGNPRHIHGWDDLIGPGVGIIPANPKISGAARLTYLAAWGQALERHHGDQAAARAYVAAFYHNAVVLDSGARSATTTFVERGIGDVLVGWENEVELAQERKPGQFEVIVPKLSILAEPPVAVVQEVAARHGTLKLAEAYLRWLYSPDGQEIIARNFFRPRDPKVGLEFARRFPKLKFFTVDGLFGGWTKAQKMYFADGAIFDQIYQPRR